MIIQGEKMINWWYCLIDISNMCWERTHFSFALSDAHLLLILLVQAGKLVATTFLLGLMNIWNLVSFFIFFLSSWLLNSYMNM